MPEGYDLAECLSAVDPADCTYQQFVEVGMALKDEGYPFSAWDDWASRDRIRYKGNGNMERKWDGFGESGAKPVTGGTVVKMARDAGWEPRRRRQDGPDSAIGWDDAIVVDPSWVEPADVEPPIAWSPVDQAVRYLEALFDSDDYVGYVTGAFKGEDGRWVPRGRGTCTRTAGELVEQLRSTRSIEEALGTPNAESGAWIRFNPLDGNGVKNADVTEFRYALVESDDMPIEKQRAMISELELPCAVIVHSGGKSLHAIVKVDAKDYQEYRERVEYLYKVCASNGLTVDTQNKNPSRLSRFPGFVRGPARQYIVSGECGKKSFEEWRGWVEELNDGLPDIAELDVSRVPDLPDPVIDGVLYPGDKMMVSGPSKAGKSFLLMELCCCLAEGGTWLGHRCARGKVLYVNLELKSEFCRRRFRDVYAASGMEPAHARDIHVLDLRGKSAPLEKLSASIIRRAAKARYAAIVIDPIYKVLAGDENSAEEVGRFCNQLDVLAEAMGCAVIYCHHHSKGAQGGKASMDRASGSGVFARDADALLDMIQLPLSDDLRKARSDAAACGAAAAFMDARGNPWRDGIAEDDMMSAPALLSACRAAIGGSGREVDSMLDAVRTARERTARETGWRVSGTLREFPAFEPLDVWFDWPAHRIDESGVLGDIDPDSDVPKRWKKRNPEELAKAHREKAEARHAEIVAAIKDALESCDGDGVARTRANVLERICEIDGKPVTDGQLKCWTGSKAKWSPYRVDQAAGNTVCDAFERDVVAPFEEGVQGC